MAVRPTITYTLHAYDRMIERRIAKAEIERIVADGVVIEEYADDRLFPSKLFLGQTAAGALRIVAAWDDRREEWVVVTAYQPQLSQWEPDFRTRRV